MSGLHATHVPREGAWPGKAARAERHANRSRWRNGVVRVVVVTRFRREKGNRESGRSLAPPRVAEGLNVMTANVKHPILRLEVLGADGTSTTDHVVFCQKQRQSVKVEECCECVHCEAITEGPRASVDCYIELGPHGRAVDPDGESTDVGTLLCCGTVVVAESVSLSRALAALRETDRRSVAVVDERHVMVGLVHETTTLFGRSRGGDDRVGAAMTSAIAVDERTPVRVALRLLAANHLREATVISKRGVPIGVFRDVDGLRWVGGR